MNKYSGGQILNDLTLHEDASEYSASRISICCESVNCFHEGGSNSTLAMIDGGEPIEKVPLIPSCTNLFTLSTLDVAWISLFCVIMTPPLLSSRTVGTDTYLAFDSISFSCIKHQNMKGKVTTVASFVPLALLLIRFPLIFWFGIPSTDTSTVQYIHIRFGMLG